jgi:hypothetical protein
MLRCTSEVVARGGNVVGEVPGQIDIVFDVFYERGVIR